jgi:hypothetical protein
MHAILSDIMLQRMECEHTIPHVTPNILLQYGTLLQMFISIDPRNVVQVQYCAVLVPICNRGKVRERH